jgi:hypothetical protein
MDEHPGGPAAARTRADDAFTRAVRREHEAIDVHEEAARRADLAAERLEQALATESDERRREGLSSRAGSERERAAAARARAAKARKRLFDEGVPEG